MIDLAHDRVIEQSSKQATTVKQRLSGFLPRMSSSRGMLTKINSLSSLDELLNRLRDKDSDRRETTTHDVTWDPNIHDSVMAKPSSQVTDLDPLLEDEELVELYTINAADR